MLAWWTKKTDFFVFRLCTKWHRIYSCRSWMNMNLRYQISWIFFSTASKSFPAMLCKLMIAVRVVVSAAGSLSQHSIVFYLLWSPNHSFLFRKLAIVSIESDRTLRIGLLKAFALREAVTYFCRGIVHAVPLDFLWSSQRHVYHS